MPRKIKLIPPDTLQCQAETNVGCRPNALQFMILGPAALKRCENKPEYIATETAPKADGQKGSMSLCKDCVLKLLEQEGLERATFRKINKSRTMTGAELWDSLEG